MRVLIKKILPIVLSLITVIGCTDRDLHRTLLLSGKNREELKQVLRHYAGDDQKLEAARYMIRYLPYHHSFNESISAYYSAVSERLDSLTSPAQMIEMISQAHKEYSDSISLQADIQAISSEFIINNIDKSFEIWESSPWTKRINFEEFCEYFLPYNCVEMQPFSEWKSTLALKYCPQTVRIQERCSKEFNNDPRAAAIGIIDSVIKADPIHSAHMPRHDVYDAELLLKMPVRTCRETSIAMLQILRSSGIPAAFDYTPKWGDRGSGHTWLSLMDLHHKTEPFSPVHFSDERESQAPRVMSKVYRVSYKPDKELSKRLRRGWKVPDEIGGVCIKDVTDEYMVTNTVKVHVDRKISNRNIYVATFANSGWSPVAYGKFNALKGNAVFEKLGRAVLYLPVCCDRNGRSKPVGEPFFLDYRGNINYFHKSDNASDTVVMSRKYPVMKYVWKNEEYLRGGIVQASDKLSEESFRTICTLQKDDTVRLSGSVSVDDDNGRFRYWRITDENERRCDIAELIFYDNDGEQIKISAVSKDAEKICDNDALTYASINGNEAYLFESKEPAHPERIDYFRRSDGNDVFPGLHYSLYQWGNKGWSLIGTQIADSGLSVSFSGVPEGALLLLKCDEKGIENRPFLWNNGEIIWY